MLLFKEKRKKNACRMYREPGKCQKLWSCVQTDAITATAWHARVTRRKKLGRDAKRDWKNEKPERLCWKTLFSSSAGLLQMSAPPLNWTWNDAPRLPLPFSVMLSFIYRGCPEHLSFLLWASFLPLLCSQPLSSHQAGRNLSPHSISMLFSYLNPHHHLHLHPFRSVQT